VLLLSCVQMAAKKCAPPPLDFTLRRNATGAFSGMAFVQYSTVADAVAACRALSGSSIDGRKIQVEFKRPETSPQRSTTPQRRRLGSSPDKAWKREKSPNEDRSIREIEDKLKRFIAKEDCTLDFPTSLSSSLRKHVHTCAASLGLQHTSEKRDASQLFVRVRKAGQPLSPSSSSLIENRVFETSTPASIRNDVRNCRHADYVRDRRRTSGSFSHTRKDQGTPRSSFASDGRVGLRPRANTVSSLSTQPIDVMRSPRGPDGTKGFHSRSVSNN
jgi:hypothetical protein